MLSLKNVMFMIFMVNVGAMKLSSEIDDPFPWTRYEAESCHCKGKKAKVSREYLTPASEATGRSYVELREISDFVELKLQKDANHLTLRYCIPDAPEGVGIDRKMSIFVNDKFRRSMQLSSKYAWIYGEYPWSNDPIKGKAHRFFDESSLFMGRLKKGDVLKFVFHPEAKGDFCKLDFVETENIPDGKPRPKDSLSLLDYGAVADDGVDDRSALLSLLQEAASSQKIAWIPEGVFQLEGERIALPEVTIQGAGMWYSKFVGSGAKFYGTGKAVHMAELSIFGNIDHRDDQKPLDALNGDFGEGSVFESLWIEHSKCGIWTTAGTSKLQVLNCRIRNTMADGINLCDGTSYALVKGCHFRNTGDDGIATWSPSGDWSSKKRCVRNRIEGNRIELPWLANGIGIYGGEGHVVKGNEIHGTVYSGAGVHVSSGFGALPFKGEIVIEGNWISGCGGPAYIKEEVGSIWIHPKDSDIKSTIILRNNTVQESAFSALSVHGTKILHNLFVENLKVLGQGGESIYVYENARGSIRLKETDLALNIRGKEFEILR
jgi:hypothetical protein